MVILTAPACASPTAPVSTGRPSGAPAASTSQPSAAPTVSYPPYEKAHVTPFDLGHLRQGPSHPVVGTAYPYDLYIHCGGELARFGGSVWRAAQPLDWLPTGGGYLDGTMELLDVDTARFVNDQSHYDSPVEVIIYRRTTEEIPRCM